MLRIHHYLVYKYIKVIKYSTLWQTNIAGWNNPPFFIFPGFLHRIHMVGFSRTPCYLKPELYDSKLAVSRRQFPQPRNLDRVSPPGNLLMSCSSWWLNKPIWKIRASQIGSSPPGRGENKKKIPHVLHRRVGETLQVPRFAGLSTAPAEKKTSTWDDEQTFMKTCCNKSIIKQHDSMTSFLEIPYPKDHCTLQWKGLNLYSRGRILKNSQFWGVRILRILRVGKFLSKINSLTGGSSKKVMIPPSPSINNRSSRRHRNDRSKERSTRTESPDATDYNQIVEYTNRIQAPPHFPSPFPPKKMQSKWFKPYNLRFWIAFQDGWFDVTSAVHTVHHIFL